MTAVMRYYTYPMLANSPAVLDTGFSPVVDIHSISLEPLLSSKTLPGPDFEKNYLLLRIHEVYGCMSGEPCLPSTPREWITHEIPKPGNPARLSLNMT